MRTTWCSGTRRAISLASSYVITTTRLVLNCVLDAVVSSLNCGYNRSSCSWLAHGTGLIPGGNQWPCRTLVARPQPSVPVLHSPTSFVVEGTLQFSRSRLWDPRNGGPAIVRPVCMKGRRVLPGGTAGLTRLAVPWGRSRRQTGEAWRYGIPAAHRRSITAPAASTPLTVLALAGSVTQSLPGGPVPLSTAPRIPVCIPHCIPHSGAHIDLWPQSAAQVAPPPPPLLDSVQLPPALFVAKVAPKTLPRYFGVERLSSPSLLGTSPSFSLLRPSLLLSLLMPLCSLWFSDRPGPRNALLAARKARTPLCPRYGRVHVMHARVLSEGADHHRLMATIRLVQGREGMWTAFI